MADSTEFDINKTKRTIFDGVFIEFFGQFKTNYIHFRLSVSCIAVDFLFNENATDTGKRESNNITWQTDHKTETDVSIIIYHNN